MDKDWRSNNIENLANNIRGIASIRESLRPSSGVLNSIKGIVAMQESLRPSSGVLESIKGIASIQDSLRPSLGVMDNIRGIASIQESLRSSLGAMDNIRGLASIQESLRPSLGVMDNIRGLASIQESLRSSLGAMDNVRGIGLIQESLRPSSGVLESMRIVLAARSEIAKAALDIPNIDDTVNSVFIELSTKNLNLNERLKILSNFEMPLESSITSTIDEEIKIEDNEFTRYWLAIYEHIIKAYSVFNTSLVAIALRDLISVLSLIVSMQGGQAPQINFYNYTESNVEVNINGNKMDVIITNPRELNIEKEDDENEEMETISNPGIRS